MLPYRRLFKYRKGRYRGSYEISSNSKYRLIIRYSIYRSIAIPSSIDIERSQVSRYFDISSIEPALVVRWAILQHVYPIRFHLLQICHKWKYCSSNLQPSLLFVVIKHVWLYIMMRVLGSVVWRFPHLSRPDHSRHPPIRWGSPWSGHLAVGSLWCPPPWPVTLSSSYAQRYSINIDEEVRHDAPLRLFAELRDQGKARQRLYIHVYILLESHNIQEFQHR